MIINGPYGTIHKAFLPLVPLFTLLVHLFISYTFCIDDDFFHLIDVHAILFIVDSSSYNLFLQEDQTKVNPESLFIVRLFI